MKRTLIALLFCLSAFAQVRIPGPGGIAQSGGGGGSGPTLINQIAWDSTVSETSSAINCSGANLLVSIGTVWSNWDNTGGSVPNGATASDSSSNTWTLVGTQYRSE